MNNNMQDTGLYWRPLGGNNIDQISGHCYQYTCVLRERSELKKSSVIELSMMYGVEYSNWIFNLLET